MKVFLFLYPTAEYTEGMMDDEFHQFFPRNLNRLNEIIDARYRRNKYQIYWLLFGEKRDPTKPDKNQLSKHFHICRGDHFISSGLTWQQMLGNIWPSPLKILLQLPAPVSDLKIGGYHQHDCVDKIASFAYRCGYQTLVDEDTTDLYFSKIAAGQNIPDEREFTLQGFGYTPDKFSPATYRILLDNRANKPWFVST